MIKRPEGSAGGNVSRRELSERSRVLPAGTVFFTLLLLLGAGIAHAQVSDLSSYFGTDLTDTATQASAPSSPVDLLFESDSYVPPFYRGRALPSAGTELHLHAIAHFGAAIPDSEITYTWKEDGEVQGQVSGAGKSSVILRAPSLYGSDVIEVDAQGGGAYGSASINISSVDPGVTLYQDHPLLGIEYYNAVENGLTVPQIEMTFAGVPYFTQAQSPNDAAFSWDWTVNGESVPATTTSASELTIDAENSSGEADIGVALTSRANVLLDAQNSWNVIFSRTTAPSGQ